MKKKLINLIEITLGSAASPESAENRHAYRQAFREAKRWGATDVSADEFARDALTERLEH